MSDKMSVEDKQFQPTEADELRLCVAELNQSIAYLSKMVLQLQRSVNDKKATLNKSNEQARPLIPETIH